MAVPLAKLPSQPGAAAAPTFFTFTLTEAVGGLVCEMVPSVAVTIVRSALGAGVDPVPAILTLPTFCSADPFDALNETAPSTLALIAGVNLTGTFACCPGPSVRVAEVTVNESGETT